MGHLETLERRADPPTFEVGVAGDGDLNEFESTERRGRPQGRNVTKVRRIKGSPEEAESRWRHLVSLTGLLTRALAPYA